MSDTERIDWLEKHLYWECGSYDGPDYLCNAENSNWALTSGASIVHISGSKMTMNLRDAIDMAIIQEAQERREK